jgi:hypothetical protein
VLLIAHTAANGGLAVGRRRDPAEVAVEDNLATLTAARDEDFIAFWRRDA